MHKRQSRMMFSLSFVVSGTIFLQMVYYLWSLFMGWDIRFNLIAVCQSWLKRIGLSSLEYMMDALVFYTFIFLIWKISSQCYQTARMQKHLTLYKDSKLTTEMNATYRPGENHFMIVSHPVPLAITMGLMHPKIVLSTGLMNLLNEDELEAVIAHEMAHVKSRDPLTIFIMTLCSSTIWYIPILKWLNQQYRIMKELAADEYAIEKQETTVHLGSALLKMLKVRQPDKMAFTYASFADTSINYRIDYMLNPLRELRLNVPFRVILLSVVIFSLICSSFLYALA